MIVGVQFCFPGIINYDVIAGNALAELERMHVGRRVIAAVYDIGVLYIFILVSMDKCIN